MSRESQSQPRFGASAQPPTLGNRPLWSHGRLFAAMALPLGLIVPAAAAIELQSPIAGVGSPYDLTITSAFDHAHGGTLVAQIPVVGSLSGLVAADSRVTAYTGETGWTSDPPGFAECLDDPASAVYFELDGTYRSAGGDIHDSFPCGGHSAAKGGTRSGPSGSYLVSSSCVPGEEGSQ